MNTIPLYWWVPPAEQISADGPTLQRNNFGDAISQFIVEQLSGRPVVREEVKPKLLAVGSIFWMVSENDTIWGSGMTSHEHWNIPSTRNIDIRAVRGPLTQQKLLDNGFSCPSVFGDPSLLMPQLYPARHTPRREWGFIPHIDSVHLHPQYSKQLIDVRWGWKRVVDEILQCHFVVSSSLHGIIIAEAYGIPAIWLGCEIDRFKFDDYYAATGRTMSPASSVEEALRQPLDMHIPTLDLQPLLDAFPYKRT